MTEINKYNASAFSRNDPITLMFVGGGNRFPAFIGALQAVEDIGLNVSKIVASSSGAIVSALYANGENPEDMLEECIQLDMRRFKDVSLSSILGNFGLCSGRRLEEWVDNRLSSKKFSDQLRIPLEIVATDMKYYRPVIFSHGRFPDVPIATAAAASTLIPGVFGYRSLAHGGKKYALIDGSLMSGVVEGRMDRTKKTLVIRVMSKRTLKRSEADRFTFTKYLHEMLTFSMHAQEKEFLKGGKWKDTIVIYCSEISPATFNLSREEKEFLYKEGYDQTRKYLEYKWGV